MKKLFVSLVLLLALFIGCTSADTPNTVKTMDSPSTPPQQNTAEGIISEDLPIDITVVTYDGEVIWPTVEHEHGQYTFEMPEDWQVVDGTEYGLSEGFFLLPAQTDPDDFLFSAHVALEMTGSMPAGDTAPDFSDISIQKEFFAAQIIRTYSKMSGLSSDIDFSVWESTNCYVYIANFVRSNDQLNMYTNTYYVMNPDGMLQVQATYFDEDSTPEVNEVARTLINTITIN